MEIRLYIHPLDACLLMDPDQNLSYLAGMDLTEGRPDVLVADGDVIEVAGIHLEVIHTPGGYVSTARPMAWFLPVTPYSLNRWAGPISPAAILT